MKLDVIRSYLKINLSPERYSHSIGVEKTALKLAGIFNISEYYCSVAGLAHDICREMPLSQILSYSGKIHTNPVLLHGEAGARKLKEEFFIEDLPILNAVRYHTSGSPYLDEVGKIIYAADFMEEGRTHLSTVERERLFLLDLDDMVLDIAELNRDFFISRNIQIEPDLLRMIVELKKEKKKIL